MIRMRVGSMHKLVTAGNVGAWGCCCRGGRDGAPVRADKGIRDTAPLRPQQKIKLGPQAMQSISGESRGKLQKSARGGSIEIEKTFPV